jgi:hypothetical protein
MSMEALREAANKTKDTFSTGTVVRWVAKDRYTYAALKTPVGWYTTSSVGPIPKVISFDKLLEIVAREETSDVAVASSWTGLDDGLPF